MGMGGWFMGFLAFSVFMGFLAFSVFMGQIIPFALRTRDFLIAFEVIFAFLPDFLGLFVLFVPGPFETGNLPFTPEANISGNLFEKAVANHQWLRVMEPVGLPIHFPKGNPAHLLRGAWSAGVDLVA